MKYKFFEIQLKSTIRTISLVFIFCFLVSACISVKPIYYDEDKKVAEENVEKFHKLLNEEKYEELYNLTDEEARAVKSKDGFMQLMKQIRFQFGKALNSSKIDSQATSQAASTKVEIIYQTKFEKIEKKERFIWIVANKKAGLFSYEIME